MQYKTEKKKTERQRYCFEAIAVRTSLENICMLTMYHMDMLVVSY